MKRILFIHVLLLFLSSCESDDMQSNDLLGSWNLMYYQCCLLAPEEFNQDEIIWTFNSNNILEVSINTTLMEYSQIPIQENSSVPYTFSANTVTLESIEYDYYFEDERLYLTDHPEVDGSVIMFERR